MLGSYIFEIEQPMPQRHWPALVSYAAQALGIITLLLVPLISIEGIPRPQLAQAMLAPPPPSSQPAAAAAGRHVMPSKTYSGALESPRRIPREIATTVVEISPPLLGTVSDGVAGSTGNSNNERKGIWALSPASGPPPLPSKPTVRPLRISRGVMEGYILKRVQPVYPPLARNARVQGVVVLEARISKLGKIEELRLISGHPLLAGAALDAVRQWQYSPYSLNGEPVEVETQITVIFSLTGS